MSVCLYSIEELTSLYAQWQGIQPAISQSCFGPSVKQMGQALAAAHRANVAAYSLAYDDVDVRFADTTKAFAASRPDHTPVMGPKPREAKIAWVQAVRLLQYNTVTNAGNDFLPEAYREILTDACTNVCDYLLGVD